jgi:hypothetical protein
MRDAEAFVKGVVAIVKDLRDRLTTRIESVETVVGGVLARVGTLEARAPVPGPIGERGDSGPAGA